MDIIPKQSKRPAEDSILEESKRERRDLEECSETEGGMDVGEGQQEGGPMSSWPKLLVVRADEGEDRLQNVAFVRLFRFLEGNVGGVTKVTRRGERVVLVEVASREASLRLQGLKTLCGCAVTVTPHGVLQQRKGVISSWDLLMDSEEDILGELRSDGVRDVRRLKKRSGGETGPSPTLLLTFEGELPKKVRVGCLSIRVRPYVQDPLRCYKCLRFGHTQARCFRGRIVCGRCGGEGHLGKSCEQAPRCTNCGGGHSAFASSCPMVVRERAIQRVMATQRRSYAEAARSYIASEGCAGTPGSGGLRTTTAGMGSAGSGSSGSEVVVAAPAGRPAQSVSVRAQTAGSWASVQTQTVRARSVGTQTEAQGHARSVGVQTGPPTVETQEAQTDIVSASVFWPLLDIMELHFLQYEANQDSWYGLDYLWHRYKSTEDRLRERRSLDPPGENRESGDDSQSESENSSDVGEDSGKEEEEMEESNPAQRENEKTDKQKNSWSPVRPPT